MNKLTLFFNTLGFLVSLTPNVLAQETVICHNQNCDAVHQHLSKNQNDITSDHFYPQSAYGLLTEAKWKAIAGRYYQSRLRTNFTANNDLLSLWDVQELIGFPGMQVNFPGTQRGKFQAGNRQYWVWRDRNNPHKKIKATFNYYQLIDIKGVEFDALSKEVMRAELRRMEP